MNTQVLHARIPHAFRALYLASSACAAMFAGLTPAAAQQVGESAEVREDVFGDIVVTAQRRAESLQDVPVAISAISGDALAAAGVNNATDLRFVAPSVNFTSGNNTRGEGLAVRGVGTSIFGDGVEQSVGVVVDQIPMARNGMGVMAMIDIARVEVLRGPQGMLFGKNASAGLVNIITNDPVIGKNTLELSGSYATLNDIRLTAVGNYSFADDGAIRIAYARNKRDGFVDNIYRDEKLNNRDEHTLRAKVLAEPLSGLRILVTGDWAQSNAACCAWTVRSAAPGQAFALLNAAAGIKPSDKNLEMAAGAEFYQNATAWGFSGQVDYDLGFATVTGISGYRVWQSSDNNDADILPLNILDVNTGFSKLRQISNEIRLDSAGGDALEWSVGLFHFDVDNRSSNTQAGTLGVALPPGTALGSTRDTDTHNSSLAAYGQLGYQFTDWLKLSASGRYTADKMNFSINQYQTPGTIGNFPGRYIGKVPHYRVATNNFSWRLIAQVEPTEDVMLFGSVARGYKGPAYDQQIVSTTPVIVQPEIPTSFELGVRSQLFNRTTIVNLTGFITNFDNFQAQAYDSTVSPARFTIVNAGELQTKGLELEVTSRPIDGLTLSANGTWLDSEYKDFNGVSCYIGQPILDYGTPRTDPRQCIRATPGGAGVTTGDGLPLTDAPRLTYTLAATYEQPVGALVLGGNVNWFWRDKVSYSANNDPNLVQDSYGLLGGALTVRDADDRWRVSLFVRNLLDKNFVNRIFATPVLNSPATAPVGSYTQVPSADARRTVGVSASFRFGD